MMTFWFYFLSNFSYLAVVDKGLFQGKHKSFQVIYTYFQEGIRILESTLSFLHFVHWYRSNQVIVSYLLVWQRFSKVSYIWSHRTLLLISIWMWISNNPIFPFCISTSHHALLVPSLLLEIKLSVPLYLLRLEKQFQKHQNQLRNSFFRVCFSRTTLSTQIRDSQGFPEK